MVKKSGRSNITRAAETNGLRHKLVNTQSGVNQCSGQSSIKEEDFFRRRCRTQFEQRDAAVGGDAETQKKFHSFALFLGELYLNLEVRGSLGPL